MSNELFNIDVAHYAQGSSQTLQPDLNLFAFSEVEEYSASLNRMTRTRHFKAIE